MFGKQIATQSNQHGSQLFIAKGPPRTPRHNAKAQESVYRVDGMIFFMYVRRAASVGAAQVWGGIVNHVVQCSYNFDVKTVSVRACLEAVWVLTGKPC